MSKDNGLLGFLQKKSLFNNDSTRNQMRKRSSSRSKGDKESIIRRISDKDFDDGSPKANNYQQQRNIRSDFSPTNKVHYQQDNNFMSFTQPHNHNQSRFVDYSNSIPNNSIPNNRFEHLENIPNKTYESFANAHNNNNANKHFESFMSSPNKNFAQQNTNNSKNFQTVNFYPNKNHEQKNNFHINQMQKPNNYNNGQVSYSMNFQSARLESAQCLETLSLKLKTQIFNINYRVDEFKSAMSHILGHQLRLLRERILLMVDQVFKQSQKNVKQYMKIQQERLAGDLLKVRVSLQKQYLKIESMKDDINKPQWRKVAGQILSTELQRTIEQHIKQSNTMQIRKWQKKQFSQLHLKNVVKELRELVKF